MIPQSWAHPHKWTGVNLIQSVHIQVTTCSPCTNPLMEKTPSQFIGFSILRRARQYLSRALDTPICKFSQMMLLDFWWAACAIPTVIISSHAGTTSDTKFFTIQHTAEEHASLIIVLAKPQSQLSLQVNPKMLKYCCQSAALVFHVGIQHKKRILISTYKHLNFVRSYHLFIGVLFSRGIWIKLNLQALQVHCALPPQMCTILLRWHWENKINETTCSYHPRRVVFFIHVGFEYKEDKTELTYHLRCLHCFLRGDWE